MATPPTTRTPVERGWAAAMRAGLTGPRGFYRRPGAPARNFRTAAGIAAFAAALGRLAERVDDALGRPAAFDVVDVGCGDARLLSALRAGVPAHRRPRWRWHAVDVAPAPPGLPPDVAWGTTPPADLTGLLICNEYLDTSPVQLLVQVDGPRVLEVDRTGTERPGRRPTAAELAWSARYWPLAGPGSRAEVGRHRDRAWARVLSRLAAGAALAVDYPARPATGAGTLTGYRAGRQVRPRPDRRTDVTAGVVFAALLAATPPGAESHLLTQRRALQLLCGPLPPPGDAPAEVLGWLAAAGERAELSDRAGFGGHRWLLTAVGIPAGPLLAPR